MKTPILSIIVPMREGVALSWLKELLEVKGDVQFILVFPPGASCFPVKDERLVQLVCPLRGEFIQRITALLNANGEYVLSINCDEYLHPSILAITENYFKVFPESMFFRLRGTDFPHSEAPIGKPWQPLVDIEDISVKDKSGIKKTGKSGLSMREIPIAPLKNPVRFSGMFAGRNDQHGPHQENFDKKVWKNYLVQDALKKNVSALNFFGPFKYIPFWTADRFMGLSVQANSYEPDKVAGHWLPMPEQLRTEDNPPNHPRKNRRYSLAEVLLLRIYPKFGYLWNLAVFHKYGILSTWFPRDTIKALVSKL